MSLYKTSKNEGVSYGVVQVEVDGELALEFEVSNGLDAENYSWGVDGEPSFASIGQWISLILNLNEELKGSLKLKHQSEVNDAILHKLSRYKD
jgi:hypothetical protein